MPEPKPNLKPEHEVRAETSHAQPESVVLSTVPTTMPIRLHEYSEGNVELTRPPWAARPNFAKV